MRLGRFGIFLYFVIAVAPHASAGVSATTVPATTQPTKEPMEAAMELAGFFAAHGIWCVSDGQTLIPLVAYETADGKRQMNRLVSDRIEEGVARGKEWMAKNPERASRAVLVYDGFFTLNSEKTDALIITVRNFSQVEAEVTLAVPYRPASDPNGFAVHRPKFLGFQGDQPDWQKLGEALWRGIAKHEKGAEVWNKHLDESK
jgi:hypothetical protein